MMPSIMDTNDNKYVENCGLKTFFNYSQ